MNRFMRDSIVGAVLSVITISLRAQQPPISSTTQGSITAEMIGRKYPPMQLDLAATDREYGYSEKAPIVVGGGLGKGSENTYRYLNALLGPNGEIVHYDRVGACCSFHTKNSPLSGKALLEVFEVRFEGGEPKRLYFNWYDSSKPSIPVGLTSRQQQ